MKNQVSSLQVAAGFYILRYTKPLSVGAPPVVEVRVSREDNQYVQILSSPFGPLNTIEEPGGCLVIKAERPTTLQLVTHRAAGSQDGEAELRLESLIAQQENSRRQDAPRLSNSSVGLVGVAHVSRRGDVPVADGVWIAGPDAPAPIEGFAVRVADVRSDFRLEYQVLVGGASGGWTPWTAGDYAGTKGQARPVLGIRMRLSGGAARTVLLGVDALFLGATVETARGELVELISGAGVDPLVGLKIALVPVPSGADPGESSLVQSRPAQQGESRAGRVRVFRASGLR